MTKKLPLGPSIVPEPPAERLPFTYREEMVPMRDGVRLQTVILAPTAQTRALPFLISRHPYGVPDKAPEDVPLEWRALARDGYIFVLQNVRGRFKSEGEFGVATLVDAGDRDAVNDATDSYDTMEWLLNNVTGHNGNIGITGVSYAGLTAALSLLQPHPALRAVSEQGASADLWMNDDFHRYGALRLSYAFEYAVRQQAARHAETAFAFETADTYDWYLDLGSLANVNDKHLHGTLSFWNNLVEHPDYDDYWKRDAWVRSLDKAAAAVLNVAGHWDQEDPWGPWQIFKRLAAVAPDADNFMVAGPWHHGSWQRDPEGSSIGAIPLGGQATARAFRETIEAPFFRHYLHGEGDRPDWRIKTFQTGANAWRSYHAWPPAGIRSTKLYLHSDGGLSFATPSADTAPFREYFSDPDHPVPYRQRPISPIGPDDWSTWEVADQRFLEHRPDVLSYVGEPLDADVRITGEITAVIFASSSGTDGDLIVKLIDVFPDDDEPALPFESGESDTQCRSLNGYQLPIAMEVRRGRYLESFECSSPLTPNRPTRWEVPLRDHDHVFRKGHRIMVQIQSTWFPLIDRNPQRFVPNIYHAAESDFTTTLQRIYATPELESHILLPVSP